MDVFDSSSEIRVSREDLAGVSDSARKEKNLQPLRMSDHALLAPACRKAPICSPDSCPTSHGKSTIEHYPSGSVVARVFLTANPSVYTPVDEPIAHCGREKKMIQPHPLV
jgi:hypothetical protein